MLEIQWERDKRIWFLHSNRLRLERINIDKKSKTYLRIKAVYVKYLVKFNRW